MSPTTNPSADACPVAALIPAFVECLEQQKACSDEDRTVSDRWGVMQDRQAALVAMAESSKATSLKGAALQLLLARTVIANLGYAVDVTLPGYDGRTGEQLERAGLSCVYSALAALTDIAGALPEILVREYAHPGRSPFAMVAPEWQEPDWGRFVT